MVAEQELLSKDENVKHIDFFTNVADMYGYMHQPQTYLSPQYTKKSQFTAELPEISKYVRGGRLYGWRRIWVP